MRVEIVAQSKREAYRIRQLRKWAARTLDIVDTGLVIICGAAVVAAFIIMMAADSEAVPVDVIMGSAAACLMVAVAAWLIRKALRREL